MKKHKFKYKYNWFDDAKWKFYFAGAFCANEISKLAHRIASVFIKITDYFLAKCKNNRAKLDYYIAELNEQKDFLDK